MSSKPEQRLGWGVPVELNGEQADDVRTLLERLHPSTGTEAYRAWCRLKGILIPPVELCAETRTHIRTAAGYLNNREGSPDESDADYEQQMESLSLVLVGMKEQFAQRPLGCEMEADSECEIFECDRCLFHESIRDA